VEFPDRAGKLAAKMIVRKHRLWEVFRKIRFLWDEVHEIAEQLEHIKSEKLINKLDDFLETYRRPSWGSHSECRRTSENRKAISELLRIKKDLCGSEGYFIRVLEIFRTRNRFGF
jgi:DtxR family Mn-dependent transcriptional regulator